MDYHGHGGSVSPWALRASARCTETDLKRNRYGGAGFPAKACWFQLVANKMLATIDSTHPKRFPDLQFMLKTPVACVK